MPKYFEDTKDLPSNVLSIQHNAVSEEALRELLNNVNGRVALSVMLPGLPPGSLGYIFIIETHGNEHSVIDIKNVEHFHGINTSYLAKIIRHASGIEYIPEIQADFHKIRNEIGLD
ncbi:MAG: hypothetical protein OXM00_04720 [Paracoccaceae bacterium]|nr:hypothetical protein [Paracoccaceae bacterium]